LSVSADGSITGVTYESPETVDGFAVSPDIARIVSFTMDRTVESDPPIENVRLATWDSTTGKYISEVIFSGEFIRSMEFSADGKFLAIGNGSDIWLWDAYNWQLKQKLTGHIGNIVDIAFLPDGKKVLSAGSDGTVRSWALQE
jgi:WD40 repeat protein